MRKLNERKGNLPYSHRLPRTSKSNTESIAKKSRERKKECNKEFKEREETKNHRQSSFTRSNLRETYLQGYKTNSIACIPISIISYSLGSQIINLTVKISISFKIYLYLQ